MEEHRVLIVAGDEPEKRVQEFSLGKAVPPYIKYYYKDAVTLRQKKIEIYEEMLKDPGKVGVPKEYVEDELKWLKESSDEDFYFDLTAEYEYDDDGNAISTANPEGKFNFCKIGGSYASPFLVNGKEAYSAVKNDIDWTQIHRNPEFVNLYERTWEMCVEGLEPVSDVDKQVYENMRYRKDYFANFKDKEEYVASCSSFWAHSFLTPFDVWVDADDYPGTQFEWMSSYYDMFIAPLPGNTRLTIFEYIVK